MLLENAAYDTLNSLKAIDTEKLDIIETYLSEHRLSWINDLTCCKSDEYKKQSIFRFLPGHRTMVLGIPEQIKQMRSVIPCVNQSATVAKKDRTDNELKSKLISNVMAYMKKNNFSLPDELMSSENIRNFERGTALDDFVCKCKFVCPFCPKNFPITHKQFWMSSNLTKHLKNHISFHYIPVESVEDDNNEDTMDTV